MALLLADDLLALEAIANIADDDISSNDGNDTRSTEDRSDSDFGSGNDSLFDSVDDDTEWAPAIHPQAKPVAQAPEAGGTNTSALSDPSLDIANAASSKQRYDGVLKRPAPSEEDTTQDVVDSRPAKLEKSFSEGLDDLLARVSLDTVPDDDPSTRPLEHPDIYQTHERSPDDLDALLAVEEEIQADIAAARTARSPCASLPDFKIPSDVFDQAVASNKSGENTYWSHTMYRGLFGQPVTLLYAKNKEQSERIARSMMNEPILGFDLEWATSGPLKGIKREVSLVQLACEDKTALFHIALHEGNTVDELFAPSLRKILESPNIIKPGVCVWRADGSRLQRVCNIRCQGLMELSHLHQVAYEERVENIGDHFMSLARQTKHVLKLPLEKDNKVRASRWELELNQRQILYAANDAYVGYMLYRHLEHRRLLKWPARQRPEFAELRIKMRQQYQPDDMVKGNHESRARDHVSRNHSEVQQDSSRYVLSATDQELHRGDERVSKLLEALRSHRASVQSSRQYTSPGMLPSDSILKSIATIRPTTKEALSEIRGVGPNRIASYGDAWLHIVNGHLSLWTTINSAGLKDGEVTVPSQPSPAMVSARKVTTRNAETSLTNGLHQRLRELRDDLVNISASNNLDLPSDNVLQALAGVRPVERFDLVRIPGAADFLLLASLGGVDLLAVVQEHIKQHTRGGQLRPDILQHCDADDNEDFLFEAVPEHKRRRDSATRWVI